MQSHAMKRTLDLAQSRIAELAAEHGILAPKSLLDVYGAPSAEVMQFRKQTGVSLDHLFPAE